MNRDKFENVFRDAHIIDVDFSVWDKLCRFVVVAREETAEEGERLPIYNVDFHGVRSIDFAFNHWGLALESGHFQWNVHDIVLDKEDCLLRIRLAGSRHLPLTEIVCADVLIEPLDISVLDQTFPGWSQPSSPLARPSIEALAALPIFISRGRRPSPR
jgi:hypothetical protein